MPYITCPTCGERGKIPPNLVGARIKCRKCGLSFMVSAPATKAVATSAPGSAPAAVAVSGSSSLPSAVAEPLQGIEVEGLDASSWSLPTDPAAALKGDNPPEANPRPETGPVFVAAEPSPSGAREYKLLTAKDKIFEGKFDLARLEEALNHYARQGWVVKAVTTPHVKGFTGLNEETLVVLLERG